MNKNTKLCRHGEECKYISTCFRAHSISEYSPVKCKFDKGCYSLECRYFHEHRETIDEYVVRCNQFKQNVKKCTRICKKMTEDAPCSNKSCSFAHTLEDLVLPFNCPPERKLEEARRIFGDDVKPFMRSVTVKENREVNIEEKDEDEDDKEESLEFLITQTLLRKKIKMSK